MSFNIADGGNENSEIFQSFFGISILPASNPELLGKNKLTNEAAIQLILFGGIDNWNYHQSREHETGNRKIDDLLNAVYTFIYNPRYLPDEDDLSEDGLKLYAIIRSKLESNSQVIEALGTTNKKVMDTL